MTSTAAEPRSYVDTNGDRWTVRVTVATVARVRDLVDENLADFLTSKGLERLASDVITLCNVLYAVVKPQADERGIDDAAFGETLTGDALADATNQLLWAIVDFCPSPRDRASLARMLGAVDTAKEAARDVIEKRLDSLTPEMIREMVDREIQAATSGESSSRSPECSESTPCPTPCESSSGCSTASATTTEASPVA